MSLLKPKNDKGTKKLILDIIFEILGSCLFSVGIIAFAKNAQFAPGGVSGVSLILNYIFPHIPVGTLTLILNIPIIIFSYRYVGKKFLLRSLRAMLILFVFTDYVAVALPAYSGNSLLAAIFSGVFIGIGLALVYMRNSSTGGTDFIMLSIKKVFPHLSLGQLILLIDCGIILIGGMVFGNIDAVLYGIITTIVSTYVIDKFIYGLGSGKMAIIVTTKGFEIAKAIADIKDRGATLIKAVGTYSKDEKQVLLCVANKNEVFAVHKLACEIDPAAFIVITEAGEIFGEGFTPHI